MYMYMDGGLMESAFAKLSLKDLLHIVLENMRKRRSRILLTIGNVFLGVALVSSMIMLSYSYTPKTTGNVFKLLNLNDYQIWVTIISLTVCVITIFNSMLISVTERYKEIGTMKCLGAKDSLILQLFIFEALVIGFIGGLLGFSIAFITTMPMILLQIGTLLPLQNYLYVMSLSFAVALLISLIATIYPAYHASKINPVDALRFEV
ncbi:MAG TPA: ABC transporter permease [Candidatus Bathyarchaeota archaeon]|nr:ABC transporter permease [Candidatus Bathyarchaeota archaeon]